MEDLLIAFFVPFFVRLFTTLTGGGGSLIIPTLLFLGLPPNQAIATNRLSGLSDVFALIKFHQHKLVQWQLGLFLAGFAALGATIGSFLVIALDSEIIEKGIGVILLLSVPMLFFSKKIGLEERKIHITKLRNIGGAIFMTVLGTIGGFFSGTGVWFSYVYLYYYGLTYLQTAGTRQITGAAITLTSLAMFIPAGLIVWPIAVSISIGGGLGAWVSAHYAKKIDNGLVRIIFSGLVLFSAIKILFF